MAQSNPSIDNAGEGRSALSCKGVWKVFGASKQAFERAGGPALTDEEFASRGWTAAVRDVSFDIARGEVFVIMGLSGSGKSTVVRCLSRLIEPTLGGVIIEGQDLLAANEAELIETRRRKMGMVFQHFALLPNRDIIGNVAFPLQVQGVPRSERETKAREMISLVGLEGRENFFPAELSGGQQQRVGIARSLATDPAIWFLDEPFSALDPLIRADLQDELLRLQSQLNKTVVFITHDLDEAIKIADRIAIMDHGRIVQVGSPEDLILNPANDYVARFTSKVPLAKVTTVRSMMTPGEAAVSSVLSLKPEQTIEAVAGQVVESAGPIAVVDDEGTMIGALDRDRVIHVLAGLT